MIKQDYYTKTNLITQLTQILHQQMLLLQNKIWQIQLIIFKRPQQTKNKKVFAIFQTFQLAAMIKFILKIKFIPQFNPKTILKKDLLKHKYTLIKKNKNHFISLTIKQSIIFRNRKILVSQKNSLKINAKAQIICQKVSKQKASINSQILIITKVVMSNIFKKTKINLLRLKVLNRGIKCLTAQQKRKKREYLIKNALETKHFIQAQEKQLQMYFQIKQLIEFQQIKFQVLRQ
ncbi:transmembrane protein, putative (macronuclear) [Tetrahymena thermophila SB210]|uniref:Transmembrane protein, putative n=1 Tax=Tetrahymena thermophila (strain SB210) TaxID=312017 RepID=W7X6S3_TETTS|nr:transmembrane protein, putative [Tetrahymena thermophila SB210]EWS72083.1 transmembrane protein, putative [Tetrahymena thermophila SB210]|eukprot:XP_012655394.1 transmembrane protein, putative [Tetrahymena thermophila SB210]